MYLQSRNAEYNVNPCLPHQFGRSQVIFLIKAGFQFHKHRHMFPVSCGSNQGINHFRMFRHTILRNHDFTTKWIVNGFIQKMNEMFKTVIRIIKQHIPFGYPAIHKVFFVHPGQEHRLRLDDGRNIRIRIGKGRQVFQIQMLVTRHKFFPVDSQRFYQGIQKIIRHFPVIHKTADGPNLTFLHLLLQFFHHALCRYIIYKHVGIT